MSSLPAITVVRAAAGCGKTTDLARRYLHFLTEGAAVQATIAITFTRRAAAELQERVSLALRAATDGPTAAQARERLGETWPLYREVAPSDPAVATRALAHLPDAPIGTTDAFVLGLLTEFAVDARLPLEPDRPAHAKLDVPIRPGAGIARALDRATRRLLDPPEGGIDPDVAALLPHLTLDDVRKVLVGRSTLDDLSPAPATEVLAMLARDLARVCAKHDLHALYAPEAPADAEAWRTALAKRTNVAGRWAVPAVAEWLAGGASPERVPYELAGWLVGLDARSRDRRALKEDLMVAYRDFGFGRLSLWDVVTAMEYPYDEPGHVELADSLRARLHRLRQRAVRTGLTAAAEAGELGYDELLAAATDLCQRAPARLHNRFRALLVDEVQDANPAQLKFYRALAALPGERPVSAYFVGDARQSIYLFRHAEPQGLLDLEQEGLRAGHRPIDLLTNHRSAPDLVMAHRGLFAALDEPMRARHWNPPASLDTLQWREDNAGLALDPDVHQPSEPVWLVWGEQPNDDANQADRRALRAFVERVHSAWEGEGRPDDTAVVLAPTWRKAQEACALIRRWAGRDDASWVDGATSWGESRVSTDVALLLRGLAEPTDDVAWLGILKHPGVGLSDAALARVRAGVGQYVLDEDGRQQPAPERCRTLGYAIDADGLTEPHSPEDQLAFSRAVGALRLAREAVGRQSVASVVDQLATRLQWRAALAAGPGGDDDLATLEVLLDWLRAVADEGAPILTVIRLLTDPLVDAPRVHLDRPGRHIVCTTIHQAKGLAWDHVCVCQVGQGPRRSGSQEPAWMDLPSESGPRRVRLEGVRFDPYRGITPFLDPLGRLASRLHAHRRGEESARLAYVAITRARRSVTIGLPGRPRASEHDVSSIVAKAWSPPAFVAPGVAHVVRAEPPAGIAPPTGWVSVSPDAPTEWSPPDVPEGLEERAPSSMGAHLTAEQRAELAESIVARIRLTNGLHVVQGRLDPPEFEGMGPSDWGALAHQWFAQWGFRGSPDPIAAGQLAAEWLGKPTPAVRDWLVDLANRLAAQEGPMWQLVTSASVRLHFELPMIGLGEQVGTPVLLSGRTDLLIEDKGQRLTIVDFKAGERSPTGFQDVAEAASLKTYAPQLESYAEAYRRMGFNVSAVALWFVRTGTSVVWAPLR